MLNIIKKLVKIITTLPIFFCALLLPPPLSCVAVGIKLAKSTTCPILKLKNFACPC